MVFVMPKIVTHLIYGPNTLHLQHMLRNFRKKHGEPDVVQIRKRFQTAQDARSWELKVLRRLKVVESSRWLNKNDSGCPPVMIGNEHPLFQKSPSKDTRAKMSIAKKQLYEDPIKGPIARQKNSMLRKIEFDPTTIEGQRRRKLKKRRNEREV